MIKNIIFDMGQVLVGYQADRVCSHFIKDRSMEKRVCHAVFDSPEWVLLDMGVISEEQGLERMKQRLESEDEKDLAELCFENWHRFNMWPMEGMKELVEDLHRRGFHIYLCSNASLRLLTCYQDLIPGIELFDGVLFSAQVKCIKPQKEMYQHLFSRFGLEPSQCLFIDDQELNVQGAREAGMEGYCFADGDQRRLADYLSKISPNQ